MSIKLALTALAMVATVSSAQAAAGFVNGGFESGNSNGWTVGGGDRSPYYNNTYNPIMTPSLFLPGGAAYNSGIANSHSAVVNNSYVDPNVGAALGSTVYSGNHAMRVEDTVGGGYASVLTQTVANYSEANIFFAWKAVLLGAHEAYDAATMLITLTDKTLGDTLITRTYNAADSGGGVDSRFSVLGSFFYTPQWQIEQLAIDASRAGHTFELSVLAADCEPTAHLGYVYLDGFGSVTPPTHGDVPEPASLALVGLALAGAAGARRRAKKA